MRNLLIKYLPYPIRVALAFLKRYFRYFLKYKKNQDEFTCPICHTKQFNLSKNGFSICYYCSALPRQRAIFHYLEVHNHILSNQNDRILQIAPEICTLNIYRKFYNHFAAIDKFEYGYNYPKIVRNMDLTDLKYSDGEFEIVICNHVLEHIPDDHQAIKEIYRVLTCEGKAFISVPIDYSREQTYEDSSISSPEDRLLHYWQEDHVRLYGLDFHEKLELVGFHVQSINLTDHFPQQIINHYGLGEETIYICSVQE